MAYTHESFMRRYVESKEYVTRVLDDGTRCRQRPEWSYCDIAAFPHDDKWRDLMRQHGCTHIIHTRDVQWPFAGAKIGKTVMHIATFDNNERLQWVRVPLRIGLID